MKKKIFALFILFMCPMVALAAEEDAYYINKNGISMTEQQYHNLQEQGFNQTEIDYMGQEEFSKRGNIKATLEARSDVYYMNQYNEDGTSVQTEVTEEDYLLFEKVNKDLATIGLIPGYVETTMFKLSTTIAKVDSNRYMFKTTMESKLIPSVRNYDVIATAYSNSNIQIDTDSIFQGYTTCYMTQQDCKSATITNRQISSRGIGGAYLLDSSLFVESINTTSYFEITKRSGVGTIKQLDAYGWYRHSSSKSLSINEANDYTISTDGIQFGNIAAERAFDVMINGAHCTWTGTW